MSREKTKPYLLWILIVLLLPVLSFSGSSDEETWSYEGVNAPDRWGDLALDFALCKYGRKQSPINIEKGDSVTERSLGFSYNDSDLKVVDTGHTIQMNYDRGSVLKIGGTKYELVHVQFHSPSEHQLAGRIYPMEVQFVHKSAEGTFAIVGVMVQVGSKNSFVQKVWDHIPERKGMVHRQLASMQERNEINVEDLLPGNHSYYHYKGSLTTPPCTQGVNWFVLQHSIEMSQAQVDYFREIYPRNARPVQSLNNRPIISHK